MKKDVQVKNLENLKNELEIHTEKKAPKMDTNQ